MRSITARGGDEATLPLGLPTPTAVPRVRRRSIAAGPPSAFVHRLGSHALTSQGLPAGTSVVVDTERTPQRGDIVFARIRGRLEVGVLGTQLGRKVLRSDNGSFWIDHTTDVWGVAVAADPPLDPLL